jgi:uncharacterized membrane protein
MPYFWIVAFPAVVFCGCQRAGLSKKGGFITVLLVTSVWLYSFAGYDYPRLLAVLLFLSILALLLDAKHGRRELALLTVVFAAIVITHSVTALATFTGLALFLVYRRRYTSLIALSSVLAVWYTYVSYQYIQIGGSSLNELGSPLLAHFQNLMSGSARLSLLLREAGCQCNTPE